MRRLMNTSRTIRCLITPFGVGTLIGGMTPDIQAASGTWNTTTSGAKWTLSSNWIGNGIANGSGFTADFSQVNITADTTVALNGNRTIGTLVFGDTNPATAGSWILNGATNVLTLAGATPAITVNALGSGKTVSINAGLSGTSGFTKNGSGALILGSSGNTLSGAVTLSAGTLQLNNASLTNASSVAINSGGLVLATTAANALGGTINFGGGNLQYNVIPGTDHSAQFSTSANQLYKFVTGASSPATFSSNLSSSGGSLSKDGAGNLTLSAANTFTGTTTVSNGNLILSNALALQNSAINATNSVTATASVGLVLSGITTPTFGGLTGTKALASLFNTASGGYSGVTNLTLNPGTGISRSYAGIIAEGAVGMTLTKTGAGTQVLSASNPYTGGTAINAGILSIGNAAALGSSGTISFAGGTLQYNGIATDLSSRFSTAASQAYNVDTNGQNVIWTAPLTSSGGTLTKSGTGGLGLTGGIANTFNGPISVNGGRLNLTDGLSHKNVTGAMTVALGAAFNFQQGFTANNLTNELVLSGPGDGTYGAFNLGGNAVATGSITLNADTTISHDWNNAVISGAVTGTNKNLTLASTVTGQPRLVVNGNISLGSGTLTKTGANALELGGANDWAAIAIEKGAVYFKNPLAMGRSGTLITIKTDGAAVGDPTTLTDLLSRVTTTSTGAIAFGGSFSSTADSFDLSNHPSLSIGTQVSMALSGTITPGGNTYRLGGGGGTLTVNSALSGSSGLVVNDAQGGTVILSGGHTYSGSTTVTAGTLRVNGSLSGAVTVAAAGTLAPGPASGIGSLTLASPLTVAGKLSFRLDRAKSQNADLITAPSLALTGVLSVNNIGPALQAGDSFKLFDISGTFTQGQVSFSLPTLSSGLMWDGGSLLTTGTLKVASVTSSPVGDTAWPGLLPIQIQAVKQAGYPSVTVNPGTYPMPDKSAGEFTFDLNGWTNFTINATGVTLVVGKQRTFQLTNCNNVTLTGGTIRARYPSFTQGRVISKGTNANGNPHAIWQISAGYPTAFATDPSYLPSNPNEVRSSSSFNAINPATGLIDLETGDQYGTIATAQGNNTWKLDFPNKTSLPFNENDWLVTRLPDADQQLSAVRLNDSTNCTLQSLTCQGGGFATVFELGGGGNHLWGYRIECSPDAPVGGTDTPVVSCAADGVHTVHTYPGLDVKDCVFSGVLLDDCIAIHGSYASVLSVSGPTVICDGPGKFAVNDAVRISSSDGFFAQATCTAIASLSGGRVSITLDQALVVPVGAKASNPKFNGSGFRIINCRVGNTRSRAIITKADDGLLSGCTIAHAGTAVKIGPEYYWNESDYSWNVTMENNLINDCSLGIQVAADGATGNRDILIRNNTFQAISKSHGISLDGCDGATISGNSFATPTAAEAISLDSSTNITLANNLVAYAPSGKGMLSVRPSVTSVQGIANGILYSGRAYALSNSLSGLLLAHQSSNAVGATLQQYSNSNASSRWILQPDGNGDCKIVSAANGLVAGVNQSSSSAAPLILETNGPGKGQCWTLAPVGTSAVKLVNRLSGFAATVQSTSLAETVTQLADTSAVGQLWTPAFDDYTYSTWRTAVGASADPMNDDDQDGIINLLEYALASDPAKAGIVTSGNLISTTVEGQAVKCLTLACQRRVAATDISFQVEYSPDLSTWQTNAVLVSSLPNPDGTTREVWRSPALTGNGSGFLRVRVKSTD